MNAASLSFFNIYPVRAQVENGHVGRALGRYKRKKREGVGRGGEEGREGERGDPAHRPAGGLRPRPQPDALGDVLLLHVRTQDVQQIRG